MLWCETSTPDLDEARAFAEAIHAEFPGKLLAYNCSPSFNWKKHLDDVEIATFQKELGAMGYRFQFITLAGFHALNASMFELAQGLRRGGHDRLREAAGARVRDGARRLHGREHQAEVGTGWFDRVVADDRGGTASTLALEGDGRVDRGGAVPHRG